MQVITNSLSGLAVDAIPTGPYSSRPPSPPYIHIPSISLEGKTSLQIVPSFSDIDSSLLTKDDLDIITGGKIQIAFDNTCEWRYELRRTAQPILDYLYLGPTSLVRDEEFLRSQGITLVLAIFDSRMASSFTVVQKRTAALGIAAQNIPIDGRADLTRKFNTILKVINDHLLQVYRAQAVELGEGAQSDRMAIEKDAELRKGKVLVCCETGNEQSASVCAAYLMSIFGLSHKEAIQFVTLQRFCVNFDDETKNMLRAYDDILSARRDVNRSISSSLTVCGAVPPQSKRHIEDTMDTSEDEVVGEMDEERYVSREFAPFVDRPLS